MRIFLLYCLTCKFTYHHTSMQTSKIKPKYTVWIVVALVLIALLWLGSGYNRMVTADTVTNTRWADVEAQYQRRFDLIPNVVETVEASARFERDTLTAVTQARTQWQTAKAAGDIDAQVAAAGAFDSALARLLVTVEAYPTIQSTQAFRDLTTVLEGTENRIAVARRDFNGAVGNYNLLVRRVPMNVVAGLFGFDARAFFEAAAGSENAPAVDIEL